MTRRQLLCGLVVLAGVLVSGVGRAQGASPWDRLKFLVGSWHATGANQLGSAEGAASFTEELDGHVIVRHSSADYTSGPEAGTHHKDLLVIYPDAAGGAPRAIYFDSEGHVIRYTVAVPDANSAVFQSDPSDPGPRYRLSYARAGNTLKGVFEIAANGVDYKTYLTWTTLKQ